METLEIVRVYLNTPGWQGLIEDSLEDGITTFRTDNTFIKNLILERAASYPQDVKVQILLPSPKRV